MINYMTGPESYWWDMAGKPFNVDGVLRKYENWIWIKNVTVPGKKAVASSNFHVFALEIYDPDIPENEPNYCGCRAGGLSGLLGHFDRGCGTQRLIKVL